MKETKSFWTIYGKDLTIIFFACVMGSSCVLTISHFGQDDLQQVVDYSTLMTGLRIHVSYGHRMSHKKLIIKQVCYGCVIDMKIPSDLTTISLVEHMEKSEQYLAEASFILSSHSYDSRVQAY